MTKRIRKEKSTYTSDADLGANFIKVVVILLVVVAIMTFITNIVINNKKKEENNESNIQYSEILLGSIFNIDKSEYYVLVEFKDDKYLELYKTYLKQKEDISYYLVDIENGFNKSYKSDEAKLDSDNIADLKFNETTLLKVKDKKIIEKYSTNETILKALEK